MNYSTRRADLSATREALLGLWARNLRDRTDPAERLRWYYQDNPAGPGVAFVLEQAADGAEPMVVGCAGVGTRAFVHDGVTMHAALLSDLAVDPEHRTLFPALMLQRTVRDHVRQSYRFAYGFPSPQAVPVFNRLGFATLGHLCRYARVLRYGRYARRLLRVPVVPDVLAAVPDGLVRLADAARLRMRPPDVRLELLGDVDSRFDRLWAIAHERHPTLGRRDAEFLRWRFFRRPDRAFRVAAAIDEAGEAVAYAIIEREERIAHLRDLVGRSADDLATLLPLLVNVLRAEGAEIASVRLLAPTPWTALLRAHGFVWREANHPVILDVSDTAGPLPGPGDWYLTQADEDV